MIKAYGMHGDRKVLLMGLTSDDCRRLLTDQPILIDLREAGVQEVDEILLLGGNTEQDVLVELVRLELVRPEDARRASEGLGDPRAG